MADEAQAYRCPRCGGWLNAKARQCPHCSTDVATVRCGRCFLLHYAGASVCSSCAAPLGLEGFIEESAMHCPRCASESLEVNLVHMWIGDFTVHECRKCTGVFVEQKTFGELSARHADRHLLPEKASVAPPMETNIRYLKCPLCEHLMNRTNFGGSSGVIIDRCRNHGLWFDRDELPAVLDFVARGGHLKAQKRELEKERAALARMRAQAPSDRSVNLGIGYVDGDESLDDWHDAARLIVEFLKTPFDR